MIDRQAEQKAIPVPLPSGSWLVWGGQLENTVTARERLTIVLPICFLLSFLLLFSTFGSTSYALLVFTGVPLGLTCGIVALWLRGMPLSISAAVGVSRALAPTLRTFEPTERETAWLQFSNSRTERKPPS
ncbi:MAG: efflux RND transporter permease subunit [Planctomycetes bacterium]|nr:efflux RND transporter permease subunit [Planctomycetota bacterium]